MVYMNLTEILQNQNSAVSSALILAALRSGSSPTTLDTSSSLPLWLYDSIEQSRGE